MGKSVHNDVLDAGLLVLKNDADKMVLCEGEPSTYSQASTLKSGGGKKLAEESMASSDFSGPVNGDTSGRKITVAAQPGVPVTESGDWDHVALLDTGSSRLLHVTPRSGGALAIAAGGTVDVNAYKEEMEDPV